MNGSLSKTNRVSQYQKTRSSADVKIVQHASRWMPP